MSIITRKFRATAKTVLLDIISYYGFLWLIINSATALNWGKIPQELQGWSYWTLLATSVIYGIFRLFWKRKITININGMTISILSGDLFKSFGQRVISVNEYFDSSIGKEVSPSSIHGQFILNVLHGKSAHFNALMETALQGTPYTEEPSKLKPNKRYDLGTTAYLEDIGGNDYYLIALATCDLKTAKVKSTREDYIKSLNGLWKKVHEYSNGKPVTLPLLGSGLSRVSPNFELLIKFILASLSSQNEIPADTINIILTAADLKKINLQKIKDEWDDLF